MRVLCVLLSAAWEWCLAAGCCLSRQPAAEGSACSYQVTVLTVGLSVLRPSRERHSIVAATDVRPKITLACQECKRRNYITRKNRRNDPDRMELKKYCPWCRCHRPHRETR